MEYKGAKKHLIQSFNQEASSLQDFAQTFGNEHYDLSEMGNIGRGKRPGKHDKLI